MKVALKELRETQIWLKIVQRKILAKHKKKLEPLMDECDELVSIFVASIRTAEKNKVPKKGK